MGESKLYGYCFFLKRTIKVTKKYKKNYIIIRKGLRFLRDEYYLETV